MEPAQIRRAQSKQRLTADASSFQSEVFDLRPGSCGFFDDSGGWTTIAQLDDIESLKRVGFNSPAPLEEAHDKINRSWHPKCSSGVSAVDLDLGTGVP